MADRRKKTPAPSPHVWPDVAAAAQELGVSVQTVRNWCAELGVPAARTEIAKTDVYRGLWLRERERAAAPETVGTEADQREQELRIAERQARIDERTARLTAVANDSARAGVIAAVRDLRGALLGQLPSRLADALAGDDDRIGWEGQARRVIGQQLTAACAALAPKAAQRVDPAEPSQDTLALEITSEPAGAPIRQPVPAPAHAPPDWPPLPAPADRAPSAAPSPTAKE